jgi:cytoskeletal protein CcmA (bactofilin family)
MNVSQSRDDVRLDNASLPKTIKPLRIPRRDVSIIASTWLVKNKLSPAEGLVIDGNLECAMAHHQQHLTISRHANVRADVSASTVVVFGQLTGNIFSDGKVTLARGSDVRGDICCPCLYVEEGARFIGRIVSG